MRFNTCSCFLFHLLLFCCNKRSKANGGGDAKFYMRIMHVGDDVEHVSFDKAKIRVILIKFISYDETQMSPSRKKFTRNAFLFMKFVFYTSMEQLV